MAEQYEVFALKFAEHPGAPKSQFFFGPTPGATEEVLELDYFFWVLASRDDVVLVDSGFTGATAARRNRPYLRSPDEALRSLAIAPDDVSLVIISHLHYDHAGSWAPFTNARFVLQDDEMAFWTGRHLPTRTFRWLIEPDDLHAYLSMNLEGRISWIDGDATISDGLSVHKVGGHTPGSQIVRAQTARGWVVLASDAAPTYEHIETGTPFGILTDAAQCHAAYQRILELADSPDLVVPGHDRLVFQRFDRIQGREELSVRIA